MRKLWQGFVVFAGLALSLCLVIPSETRSNFVPLEVPPGATTAAIAASASAPGPIASPEEVGLSSQRLERIGETIQRSIDAGRVAGAVSLVARHGRIAYFKAFGMADREAKKPMSADNIFRICSMSKPITTAAVMMLYEEGRFTLNEPVSDFIPEFKNMKVLDPPFPQDKTSPPGALVDAKRPITIFHLLTHTSGLTYPWNARLGKAYDEAKLGTGILQQEGSTGDSVKKLAALPLLFQPGDAWEYSLSDDVLGYLVEKVSGMPLDRFLEERLFKPLGMKDTYFFLPGDKVARLATAYTYYADKGLQPFAEGKVIKEGNFAYSADYPYRGPRTYFSGGGGLCSTAEDYYRFCQMMLNGGELNGTRVLSRKSVELMTLNHTQGKTDGFDYGLGFGVTSDSKYLTELGSLGAYYWGGFFYTSFVIDPKEDMIAIFMGQLHPTGDLDVDGKAIRLAYQALDGSR
ncbi:MAG TPA: serine hydrolase domain-containing protein [Terriglobia bacterium]|nr:serine hydrolase domain-containing protein [Terriglobia bacterium]